MSYLPLTRKEMLEKEWDTPDIILVTGDAYVDHPSYGTALIGRVLEHEGYRVGIIAQPDWRSTADFVKLGRPKLFFGITAGNMDSMVSNYTANKKVRRQDDYSPGGKTGLRPDRATIVYANRVREAFGDVAIVAGGIEASLRRLAHYDWWDDTVRRSILLDARADILVYGMGEQQILEIARRLHKGCNLEGIRGTTIVRSTVPDAGCRAQDESNQSSNLEPRTVNLEPVFIPSYEEVKDDKKKFNEALRIIHENQDPFYGKTLAQKHGNRYVIQYPPALPLAEKELDALYRLPFTKTPHPSYASTGGIPGFETVKFSLISHRGCPGQCSFCALSMHQGRIVQSRSGKSLIEEARALTERGDFKGTISDIGGPTANLYRAACANWVSEGACPNRSCITPRKCKSLQSGYRESLAVYRSILKLPRVKHLFIESGIRFDLLNEAGANEYLEQLCTHHISGQMKIAPEHAVDRVLKLMNKPAIASYEDFSRRFRQANMKASKKQFLVHYFISAHPGSTLEDALALSLYLISKHIYPEQIQDFMPLPMTLSGAMFYTGEHPLTGEKLAVAKTTRERNMQRALVQYRFPKNKPIVREALKLLNREDVAARLECRL